MIKSSSDKESHDRETSKRPTITDNWPDPQPLKTTHPPVEPFYEGLLPDAVRPFALDVAELMQVPLDFAAVASVNALAGAVNRRARIQPKERDDSWRVVPNLWGGLVAPPGGKKSPLMGLINGPLMEIENRLQREYAASWAKFQSASRPSADEPDKPKRRRLVVNDATFEQLHVIMSENSGGVFVIRDELTGWLGELDRAGREGERAFFLSAWSGDRPHTIDRIGRGCIHVPACCLSMFGAIQPALLRGYLNSDATTRLADDGLIQRFQLLIWPDAPPTFTYIDRRPDSWARQTFYTLCERLTALDPENPLLFRFGPEAQEVFVDWLSDLETRLLGTSLSPLMAGHLGKYRSLFPSLALLFELADRVVSEGFGGFSPNERFTVSFENAWKAINWMVYLESHAARIYSLCGTPEQSAATQLGEKIKFGIIREDSFSCRQIAHKSWRGLNSVERVKSACLVLEKLHWLRNVTERPAKGSDGGRPSLRYAINPKIYMRDDIGE